MSHSTRWTTEKPSEAGYYACRRKGSSIPSPYLSKLNHQGDFYIEFHTERSSKVDQQFICFDKLEWLKVM